MRPLDLIRSTLQSRRELSELRELYDRLRQHVGNAEERRDDLCMSVVAHARPRARQAGVTGGRGGLAALPGASRPRGPPARSRP